MDRLTFVSEMTKALAWPAAIVLAILLFRRSVLGLLPQLSRFKYDKVELQFVREVAAAQKQAQESLPAVSLSAGSDAIKQELMKLAMQSPEAAIVEAWRYLESQLIEATGRRKIPLAPAVRVMPMVQAALLHRDGLLSDAQHALFQKLRDLRNEVSHSLPGQVDIEQAASYVDTASHLGSSLSVENVAHDRKT